MGVPGNANALLLRSAAAAGGYQVSRSLRFNSSDSAFLSRTPASAGNRKTWTWAGWVKRSTLGAAYKMIFSAGTVSTECSLRFTNSPADALEFYQYSGGGFNWQLVTTQVFRDPSAWYHIVAVVDSTQATSSDRAKLYVNGVQVTAFGTASYPTSNYDSLVNSTTEHGIGRVSASQYFDGYLADIHFIDGQALTPSSFTEVSATTGQLIPKAYTGSYGTNGFRLSFSDNSGTTSTTLGKDAAGSNNWTPNNFSVASGSGNDSLVDTPTSYGTDTYVGGEVRGNYCTLNPLNSGGSGTPTLTNGNLDFSLAPSVGSIGTHAMGSIAVTAGKYYWEVNLTSNYLNAIFIGLMRGADYNTYHNTSSGGVLYFGYSGDKAIDGVFTSYGNSYTNNDIIGIALNVDAGTVTFYKNNSPQGVITLPSSTSGWKAYVGNGSSGGTQAGVANFGQRPFAYTAPSGFKALCDTNLPAPVVAKPNTVMDVITYTGTGSSLALPNGSSTPTSISFTPDFAWIKGRSGATDHALYDAVRGVQKDLVSNSTSAETTETTGLTAFGTNTFTVGSLAKLNTSSSTYVAWAWNAGGSTVTNTQGSITSSVRANASAGFSIVTYAGSSSGSTVGHGLGVAPAFIIGKRRDGASEWSCYHQSLGNGQAIILNTTAAGGGTSTWNYTTPTSSVVTLGAAASVNYPSYTHVLYCFAPVAGYSSFGSYTGNGSADGPFVYTGFRPRFLLIKYSSGVNSWMMQDSARDTYNPCPLNLTANGSGAENDYKSSLPNDMLSNGFKLRNTNDAWNGSGGTYIYAAFAESPFQFSRAR